MTRKRKAALTALFAYFQFGLAIVTGIVLVPLILHYLGARNFGLWLATGELLGYAVMVDLGVLGVFPWMLAEADGRRDRDAMRRLLSNGVAVGALVGIGYGLVALLLWALVPTALHLGPEDRAVIGQPLAILVAATTIGYPLRIFRAALGGLQDVAFNGALSIAQSLINVVLTVVLLVNGYGIYALAWASVGSSLPILVVAMLRLVAIAPDLMSGWPRPALRELGPLFTNGLGVWVGAFGWQMLAASNSIVIAYLGHPEWIPIYSCTAKLSAMCLQLAWVLPDSALIGLAQLYGERKPVSRLTEVVVLLLQLHLLLAGAAMCAVLAFNPAFVVRWVGPALFGGVALNTLLAVAIVMSSFIHGLITTASLLGDRLQVGVITLVNGALQLPAAIFFGHRFGLHGVAAATLLTGVVTAIPAGIWLLRRSTDLTFRRVAVDLLRPWLMRVALVGAMAAAVGALHASISIWVTAVLTALVMTAYLWQMRPLYQMLPLPLDPRWTHWLVSLRLLPPLAPATTGAEQP